VGWAAETRSSTHQAQETRPKVIASLAALRDKYSTAPARKHGNVPL